LIRKSTFGAPPTDGVYGSKRPGNLRVGDHGSKVLRKNWSSGTRTNIDGLKRWTAASGEAITVSGASPHYGPKGGILEEGEAKNRKTQAKGGGGHQEMRSGR